MTSRWFRSNSLILLALAVSFGCASPHRADQGALVGGLLGAGTGALIGSESGNAGAGAAIGAGLGAITGGVVGSELDEIEAQNRALIEAKMGRQIRVGAVTQEDVVTMTQAGVDEELIVNHIRAHGMTHCPGASDLVYLNQQGVSKRVVMAMQETPPVRQAETVIVERAPRPVIVEEYYYGRPWYGPPIYHRPYPHYHRPGVSWGVTFRN